MKLDSIMTSIGNETSTESVATAARNAAEVQKMYNPGSVDNTHATSLNMVAHDLTGEQY